MALSDVLPLCPIYHNNKRISTMEIWGMMARQVRRYLGARVSVPMKSNL